MGVRMIQKGLAYFPVKVFSISSNMILAAITPPAVFQKISLTLWALPSLTAVRFLNRGSIVYSSSTAIQSAYVK